MKEKIPEVGQEIYIDSSYHISNGSADFRGGLATIRKTYKSMSAGEMVWFIEIAENPGTSYNYAYLMENDKQQKLEKIFGKERARPDPDIDTPWIEDGDIVNGKTYHGDSIW